MLRLSGFELCSRWVPLNIEKSHCCLQIWTLFRGRLSFMSMQFTESKYEQHTTEVSGPYIIWNGVNIITVLKNLVHTRPNWFDDSMIRMHENS